MKKIIYTLFVFNFLVLNCFADSKIDERQTETVEKLQKEYSACLNKPNSSESATAKCLLAVKKKHDIEIEKVLKELKNVMSETQYEELIKSQKSWNDFIDQQNVFFDKTPKKAQIDYYIMLSSIIKTIDSKKRLKELTEIYSLFSYLKSHKIY